MTASVTRRRGNNSRRQASLADAPITESTGPAGVIDTMPIDKLGNTAEVIRVPEDFEPSEGVQLTEEYVIGKILGDGVQGQVYVLDGPDGKSTNKLLKIMKYKEATAVTGLDIGMAREWLIGQQLDKFAEDGSKDVPGFVRTSKGVVTGSSKEDTKFLGLLMDKVNGKELEKRLWKDESWADARYTLEMLRQVLTALDRAQKELGFLHGDMRIANIMEHRPEGGQSEYDYVPRGYKPDKKKGDRKKQDRSQNGASELMSTDEFHLPGDKEPAPLSFKVIDFGHARLLGDKAPVSLPGSPQMEQWYRRWFEGKGDVWRLLQDLSDSIDGRSWPEEQAVEVWLLLGLIREVTNVQLTPFFHRNGQQDERGWSWERIGGLGHTTTRYINRAKAFLFATKTEYSAAEALDFLKRHSRKADYAG